LPSSVNGGEAKRTQAPYYKLVFVGDWFREMKAAERIYSNNDNVNIWKVTLGIITLTLFVPLPVLQQGPGHWEESPIVH